MSRNKELGRKIRLLKQVKSNRRVPGWVMMRTNKKFVQNSKRRNWRKSSLKL